MKTRARILYVEDDLTLSFVTKDNLQLYGYEVDAVEDGARALEKFQQDHYDLCILDVMLPRLDGFTLAERIRKLDHQVPILFVTARSTKEDKLHGLKLGGDDYLTKPFSMEELVLKIDIFLRRRSVQETKAISSAEEITPEVSWDPVNLMLRVGEETHTLTHREAELLSFLLNNRERVIRREELLIGLWGHDHFFSSRSLDVFISRLRKYLGDHGLTIENVYNVGYRIKITRNQNNSMI